MTAFKWFVSYFTLVCITIMGVIYTEVHIKKNYDKVYSTQFVYAEIGRDALDLAKILHAAKPNEVITLYIMTPGGDAVYGWELLKAINKSTAKIILTVRSHANSLGAIMVCGKHDGLDLDDDAILLFHTMQTMNGLTQVAITRKDIGKESQLSQMVFKRIYEYVETNCRKAFTDKEWTDMWDNGTNILMTGKEYKKRMGIVS